jgi:membrane-associated phospholipid phosphatase
MNTQPAKSLKDRLRSQLPLKFLLTLVLYPVVYGPYLFLQYHHFFPPTELHPTPFDQWIPFDDRLVWIYLSACLLMPIGPVLMITRDQLYRYAAGIVVISVVADVVFVFHPTICPRPNSTATEGLYQCLVAVDQPFHGFPSLHAAFAIYSAFCAWRIFREFDQRHYANVAVGAWAALILYSTLATKQHMLLDIVGGSVLGTSVYFVSFRTLCLLKTKSPPALVEPKPPQSIQPIA